MSVPRRHIQNEQLIESLEPRALLAGDHPSLSDFPAATSISLVDNLNIRSAVGISGGTINFNGDDDLFMFVAPYSGRTALTVAQNQVGGLAPAIRLYDSNGNPLGALSDGYNGVAAIPPIPLDTIEEGETYYINIRAGTPSDTNEPAITGAYTVVIVMEIPPQGSEGLPGDDLPVELPLDPENGEARQYGFIIDGDDVDHYYLDTLGEGEVVVSITTPASDLHAVIQVLDLNGNVVASGMSDELSIGVAFQAGANERYELAIAAANEAAPWSEYGAYTLDVRAALPDDDHAPPTDQQLTVAEMTTAAPLGVDLVTGLAETNDSITAAGDSDVFTFRALRDGIATVMLERPDAGSFETILDVFRNQTTRMALDAVGGEAWLGRVTFNVVEGSDYYIRVRGLQDSLGSYTLKANSPLAEYVVMYPEGYSTSTIDEYVPLVNPNNFPVTYTLTARYEIGERDQVIATGVIPAASRGGVTITSQRTPGASLARVDTPYALELRSSGPLGATLSHYDFGVTTGENFTARRSTSWTFAEARRDQENFRDFLVLYNPNPSATVVQISLIYTDGEVVSFTRELDAFRRGGVNFTNDTALARDGVFSIRVDSDQPIVAALSSYDITEQRGYGLLGDANAGDTHGAIPILAGSPGARPDVAVFNSSGVPATITFTTTVLVVTPVEIVREFTIPAGQRRTIASHELGIDQDGLAALRYTSTVPVTVASSEYHTGDGDSTSAGADAVASSIIADAFVNPAGAGTTYRELLSIYNPWQTATQVQITLLSEGGVLDALSVNITPQRFTFIRVDQIAGILAQPAPVAFSIRIDGAAPVVAAFMHYDLFLDGGWGTLAAPLGLVTRLAGA